MPEKFKIHLVSKNYENCPALVYPKTSTKLLLSQTIGLSRSLLCSLTGSNSPRSWSEVSHIYCLILLIGTAEDWI